MVRSFYGAGASDALTQGGQVVYIEGENLGPIGSEFLSAVAYVVSLHAEVCTASGDSD